MHYIGTKIVRAEPMTAAKAVEKGYRTRKDDGGSEPPQDEDGYEVTYKDGYKSWSPKDVFDDAYSPITSTGHDSLPFGAAILALKQGLKVSREGWNGKGMWLKLVEPYLDMNITDAQSEKVTEDSTLLPYIGMKTADNQFVPWLASQTDILSGDWGIVE